MREILFRGKTDNGEWVYGYYTKGFRNLDGNLEDMIYIFSKDENERRKFDYAVIIPETIGQYTGLTDKNGKKIFEGDIIKYHGHWVYTIRFDEERLGFYINDEPIESSFLGNLFGNKCEIIGNIHDNPELLKGGANG